MVLLSTTNVIDPDVCSHMPPPPELLKAWLSERAFLRMVTFIVVPVPPLKFTRSPTAEVRVLPSEARVPPNVAVSDEPLLASKTAKLEPPLAKFWIAPNVDPFTVSVVLCTAPALM